MKALIVQPTGRNARACSHVSRRTLVLDVGTPRTSQTAQRCLTSRTSAASR
jgi:hypothetical protein